MQIVYYEDNNDYPEYGSQHRFSYGSNKNCVIINDIQNYTINLPHNRIHLVEHNKFGYNRRA